MLISNLTGRANVAQAISGAFVVIGGTFGVSYFNNAVGNDESAERPNNSNDNGHNYHLPRQDIKPSLLMENNNNNRLNKLIYNNVPSSSFVWSMFNDYCYHHSELFLKSTCEAQTQQQQQQQQQQQNSSKTNNNTDPSYPDFSRFGSRSYLRRYLTPEVYASLKGKKTKNNVTLEDIIRSGLSLPIGAAPPRGIGVYAGDEESYNVFSELLVPLIEDYHHYHFVETKSSTSTSTSNNNLNGKDENDNRLNNSNNNNDNNTVVDPLAPATTMVSSSSSVAAPNRRITKLRRQFTNLNPNYVLQQKLDPTGDYILKTRMRVARSIKGFPFSPVISREQRRELEQLFKDCVDEDWNNISNNDIDEEGGDDDDEIFKNYNNNGGLRGGTYLRVMDTTNDQHDDLITRHILFHDPDELNISASIGRDWPDGRGIYLSGDNVNGNNAIHSADKNRNDNPGLVMWLNQEDHLRIIATSNSGDLSAVFTRLSRALTQVEQSLHKRGHAFCIHPRYGFVNTSPENLGTALRASVFIKLYRLGQLPGFDELLVRLHLESSSRFKEKQSSGTYTGIFDIANSERLGQSEVQLIDTMISGVGRLIELEKRLEQGETIDLNEVR
mmetsp:Transcript_43330/g.48503  ORF Transcript_43330/g.48503 Transcript_43330/m.48503 type:complete len:611 (-) Transcript_43330:2282-4114(-)